MISMLIVILISTIIIIVYISIVISMIITFIIVKPMQVTHRKNIDRRKEKFGYDSVRIFFSSVDTGDQCLNYTLLSNIFTFKYIYTLR